MKVAPYLAGLTTIEKRPLQKHIGPLLLLLLLLRWRRRMGVGLSARGSTCTAMKAIATRVEAMTANTAAEAAMHTSISINFSDSLQLGAHSHQLKH